MIGNGHYPDAHQPLTQSINDARALTTALRQTVSTSIMVEDATRTTCAARSPSEVKDRARYAW